MVEAGSNSEGHGNSRLRMHKGCSRVDRKEIDIVRYPRGVLVPIVLDMLLRRLQSRMITQLYFLTIGGGTGGTCLFGSGDAQHHRMILSDEYFILCKHKPGTCHSISATYAYEPRCGCPYCGTPLETVVMEVRKYLGK